MSVSEKTSRQFIDTFLQLPEEDQKAMGLLIANYDLLRQICLSEKYTNEQRAEMILKALEQKDPFRMTLVCLERVINGN